MGAPGPGGGPFGVVSGPILRRLERLLGCVGALLGLCGGLLGASWAVLGRPCELLGPLSSP
eukprot:1871619-Pyramimonas_sp.AAC.1